MHAVYISIIEITAAYNKYRRSTLRISVEIFCEILQLLVTRNCCVISIELIDDVAHVGLDIDMKCFVSSIQIV